MPSQDYVYVAFYALQIVAISLMDAPSLPGADRLTRHFPALHSFHAKHVAVDPMLSRLNEPSMGWYLSFLYWELVFSLPVFLIAIRFLLRRRNQSRSSNKSTWPLVLMLIQSAHQTTTVSACVLFFWQQRKQDQDLNALVKLYAPFLLVPFCATIDFAYRIVSLTQQQQSVDRRLKRE